MDCRQFVVMRIYVKPICEVLYPRICIGYSVRGVSEYRRGNV